MKSLKKTNDELLNDLGELQKRFISLEASFKKDISRREKAEKALNESEVRFRRIVEMAPIAMAVVSETGVIEFINNKAERIFKYRNEDIPNMEVWFNKAYPDESYRNEVITDWQTRVLNSFNEGKEIVGNVYRVTCKTGEVKTTYISGVWVSDKILVMFEDITERKIAEEALRESEEKFRILFDENPMPTLLSEIPSGKIAFVNKRCLSLFGMNLNDVIGKTANDLGFLKNQEEQDKLTQLISRQGYVDNIEIAKTLSDGTQGADVIFMRLVTINKKLYCLTIILDISNQKAMQEELRKSEFRYRRLIETTDTGYVIIDRHGAVIDANQEYIRLSGHTLPEEIIGRNVMEWTAEGSRGKNTSALDACIVNGFIRNLEVEYTGKRGKITPVEINATMMEKDGKKEILSLCRDITERKNSELALKESEERFARAFRTSPYAFIIAQIEDGRIVEVNDAFTTFSGYSREEALAGSTIELKMWVHDDDRKRIMQMLLIGEPVVSQEIKLRSKSNIVYTTLFSAQLLKLSKGNFVISIVENITDRKKAELLLLEKNETIKAKNKEYQRLNEELLLINEELKSAKAKAEESDRLKTAFLQNMSHEIRTPMNAIMGFSELLIENYNNREKLEKFSGIINQRSNDLLEIINHVLDIAKIESGQIPVTIEECNLNDLFSELTSFFKEHQQRIGKNHISLNLTFRCDTKDNFILTDKVKLNQIFINLIGNAFKFTESGKIEGGCMFDKNNNLVFYVSDTGMGIPKDKFDAIFERFTQIKHENKVSYGGTGLGLSIVKGLVELMGGKLWLESQLEDKSTGKSGNTTFYFSFPYKISNSPVHGDNNKALSKDYHFEGKTILVVDDDKYNAAYIKEILSKTGLEIIHTEFGIEAVQIATSQLPDLILMDIRLPDIDGYEAARQIKLKSPDVSIIAQTAYAANEDKQKAIEAGFKDYISKPIKRNLLLSIIDEQLSL